ncbi:MAG: ribonuclease PH [bacterium]|nr:ribonuclease PH [bacterium]
MKSTRIDGRKPEELRPIRIIPDYLEQPLASVLVEFGRTKVVCAASVEEAVPRWLREESSQEQAGWVTSEYSMLPYASGLQRSPRESSRGRIGGRTHEIQRLIGRSLRSVVDLQALGERTVWLDCDVLQADGGTRTAAISGGFVSLAIALGKLKKAFSIEPPLWHEHVAAVSVGIVDGKILLDLCYEEDSRADVDMNVVATESGKLVEVQATAEHRPFTNYALQQMLSLAKRGITSIIEVQKKAIEESLWRAKGAP